MIKQNATSIDGLGSSDNPIIQPIMEAFRQALQSVLPTVNLSLGSTRPADTQGSRTDDQGDADNSDSLQSAFPDDYDSATSDGQDSSSSKSSLDQISQLFSAFEYIKQQINANGGAPSQAAASDDVDDAGGSDDADSSELTGPANEDEPTDVTTPPNVGAPPGGAASGPASPTQAPDPGTSVGKEPAANNSQSDPAPAAAPGDKNVALDPAQVTGPKAGTGPNASIFRNDFDHPITIGQFTNGGSTTVPEASITLQPGQTGMLSHADGEGGFIAMADASGQYQPNASRYEFETDPDGKMSYPDVSDIDGRNAAIWFTDGKGLTKGDTRSIADGAPADATSVDAAGRKTITGDYDNSTQEMRDGAAYMTNQLGTLEAYQHPSDDHLTDPQNPMRGTSSKVVSGIFAPP